MFPADDLITVLRAVQERKGGYLHSPDVDSVRDWLIAFRFGWVAAGGIRLGKNVERRVQERRGWKWMVAAGPVPEMRERGMTDEAIMDELIEIEVIREHFEGGQ